MCEHPLESVGFVVNSQSIHDGGARFIQPDYFHLGAVTAKFQNNFVQCSDRGEIPEMRMAHVNANAIDGFLEIKPLAKSSGRGKKYLPGNSIRPAS